METAGIKTEHRDLLNALDRMQQSHQYALRRVVLNEAEMLIVKQEQQISQLKAVLNELLDNGTCYRSAIELAHDYNGETWEAKAMKLLGRTEPGANA